MKNKSSTWQYLKSVAEQHRWGIFTLTVLQGVLGISSVLYAMILRDIFDGAAAKEEDRFWKAFVLLVCIFVFQNVGWAVVQYLNELCRASLENRMKHRLFSVLLTKNYAQVTKKHSGEWMNRLTSDVQITAGGLVDLLPDVLETIIRLTAALGMIVYLEYRFLYLLVPGAVILVPVTYFLKKKLRRYHKDIQEANGKVVSFFQEHLGNLILLKSFSAEKLTLEEVEERLKLHKSARMRRSRFYNLCQFGFSSAMDSIYLLGILYGGYGILTGTVTYGTLMALLQLIGYVQGPVSRITGYLPQYYAMIGSAERLMEAESYSEEEKSEFAPDDFSDFYKKSFSSIECQEISFSYPDDTHVEVLRKLNLGIHKGEIIAFTGESGCGKSTLFKLFLCLYPLEAGSIQIIEKELNDSSFGNEQELYKKKCELTSDWRGLFAYVPQGNHLMTGTIREAVIFGNNDSEADSSEEKSRLKRALQIACADGFVEELENGWDTVLGERGAGLSEGQLQRLAIARAVYRDSPVLLLDEATSALDEETERSVLSNLKELTDKTVLIVTHRPAALTICNRVICFTGDGTCCDVS